MREEWKSIKGYETLYEVSNYGNVKSLSRVKKNHSKLQIIHGKTLKPEKTRLGYLRVGLSRDGKEKKFLIHRLVADAFIGKNNGLEINHKDGNKANNHVSNLEWVTRRENIKHAFETGLNKGHEIQSKNLLLEYNGEVLTLSQWSRKTGIKVATLSQRVKNGWSVEETLTTKPIRGRNQSWRKEVLK